MARYFPKAEGQLMSKPPQETINIIESMTQNDQKSQHQTGRYTEVPHAPKWHANMIQSHIGAWCTKARKHVPS
ncbi:hypothetical protein Lal_00039803 [Lupinus albus]|nr:hypothetical protein Lal_00039803 [Lupinus albus]